METQDLINEMSDMNCTKDRQSGFLTKVSPGNTLKENERYTVTYRFC